MAMCLYQGKICLCLQGWKKGIYLYIYIYLYVYNTVNKENSNREQDLYTIQYSSEEEGLKH